MPYKYTYVTYVERLARRCVLTQGADQAHLHSLQPQASARGLAEPHGSPRRLRHQRNVLVPVTSQVSPLLRHDKHATVWISFSCSWSTLHVAQADVQWLRLVATDRAVEWPRCMIWMTSRIATKRCPPASTCVINRSLTSNLRSEIKTTTFYNWLNSRELLERNFHRGWGILPRQFFTF